MLSHYFSHFRSSHWHYRALVSARFFTAIVAGYGFTALTVSLLTLLLPLKPIDAVLVATTLSIAIYTATFIAIFAIRSLRLVWLLLLCTACLEGALLVTLKAWI